MEEITLDIKELVSKKIDMASISLVAIEGLQYSDVAILTADKDRNYFWSTLNTAYKVTSVDGDKEFFPDEYEAIFRAMLSGKTVYKFENINEFSKWLYERKQTKPKQ